MIFFDYSEHTYKINQYWLTHIQEVRRVFTHKWFSVNVESTFNKLTNTDTYLRCQQNLTKT